MSADSFAISRSAIVASINLCLFAGESHELVDAIMVRSPTGTLTRVCPGNLSGSFGQ